MDSEMKKNNKILIKILITIIILLLCVVIYLLFGKELLNEKVDSNVNVNLNYLSFKDFPIKDDISNGANYIKYKGQISFMDSASLDKNKKTLTSSFENYNFSLTAINTVCVTEDSGGFLESEEYSLKINDKLIFESSIMYPYILITDKYLIIEGKNVEHYDEPGFEDNLEKLGNIYIYDRDLNKLLEINNINTYQITKKYEKFNGALDFSIKNNVLYYVTGNGDSRALKYVDLNENSIIEKTLETFNYSDDIIKNINIQTINQFPIEHSFSDDQSINGYDLAFDIEKDIMIISKSNSVLKEVNYVSWFDNPNNTNITNLLGGGAGTYIYNNKVYYIINNKNNTLTLKSIDFNNELKEEIIETFKKYEINETANSYMFLGECNPEY